jgi:hypothetical protein
MPPEPDRKEMKTMTPFNIADHSLQHQSEAESFVALGQIFQSPDEVMNDPTLSREEKRAILASWASDARAVESQPTLRQIPGGARVRLEEIVHALRRC